MANMAASAVAVSQDEDGGLARGVAAGQGDDRGANGVGPGLPGRRDPAPDTFVEVGEHHVGPVDLIAGATEVVVDRAELGPGVEAVSQDSGGLRLIGVVPERACLRKPVLRSGGIAPVSTNRTSRGRPIEADASMWPGRCARPLAVRCW